MSLMAVANSDCMTELLALIERDHQRIADLERSNEELGRSVQELREELAKETHLRRVQTARYDRAEYDR